MPGWQAGAEDLDAPHEPVNAKGHRRRLNGPGTPEIGAYVLVTA